MKEDQKILDALVLVVTDQNGPENFTERRAARAYLERRADEILGEDSEHQPDTGKK